MWCVIPVAGRATRLRGRSAGLPKALIHLGDHSLIERLLARIGDPISDVCLVTAPDSAELFRHELGAHSADLRLHYAEQAEPAGVADAVRRSGGLVSGPFAVVMGDCYFDRDLGPRFAEWRGTGCDGGVLVEPAGPAGGQPMGLVSLSGGHVASIHKGVWEGRTRWRVAGAFVFPESYFKVAGDLSSAAPGELELEDVVVRLAKDGARFSAIRYEGWRRNINTPEDLAAVEERLTRGPGTSLPPSP